ncbi:MAG: hypothetical protein WA364_24060 [Candidatus Nitrosopolaris sp.]|jgi:hypothetical protein
MATRREHPERYGWWINELNSLGVVANKFNNLRETRSLVENMKHDLYQHDKPHSL